MAVINAVAKSKLKIRSDDGSVGRVYEELKRMAISFEFRPGDRINEVAIARLCGVSRTPLREALNRLTADGFLTFSPNKGFFRKPLEVKEIFDLYELRLQVEEGAARLAVARGTDESLDDIEQFLNAGAGDLPERTIDDLVALDEGFHERVTRLTGNTEMLRTLQNINGRIQYVRWIDMQGRRDFTQAEHRAILQALRERDANKCVALMHEHIEHRMDQIIEAVKKCYARIYVAGA